MEVKPEDSAAAIRKNSFSTSAAILISRVLGLAREQVFAHFFGAGWVLDAFVAAYRIPNLMRDLVAEGALSQAFVAVFARKHGAVDAHRLADKMLTFVFLAVGGMTALGAVFAPQITGIVASGFDGAQFEITAQLTRVLFPFLVFAAVSAILMGMLNVKGRFFLPQSSTAIMNAVAIAAGLAAAWSLAPDYMESVGPEGFGAAPGAAGRAILGMAIGVLTGAVAACLALFLGLGRLGYRPRFNADFKDPDLGRIGKLALPAALGAAAVQVNVLVNTAFASFLEPGSISYLNYAFRLMQFPLGLFGAGIAVAAAPSFARSHAENRVQDFTQGLRGAIKLSLFFGVPASLGLAVLAEPIISLIYEHGRFGALDTVGTSYALIAYSAGICGYALTKIYQSAFLAHHDAKTPMLVSFACIVLNLALNAVFVGMMGYPHWALASSTAVSATAHFLFFALLFRKKNAGIWNREMWGHLGKVFAASLLMAATAAWVLTRLDASYARQNGVIKTARVFLPIVAAITVYFAAAASLKIGEARLVLNKIGMKRRAP